LIFISILLKNKLTNITSKRGECNAGNEPETAFSGSGKDYYASLIIP